MKSDLIKLIDLKAFSTLRGTFVKFNLSDKEIQYLMLLYLPILDFSIHMQ